MVISVHRRAGVAVLVDGLAEDRSEAAECIRSAAAECIRSAAAGCSSATKVNLIYLVGAT